MNDTNDLTATALAAALDGAPFVARLPGSAVLSLTGSDARGFLHGQLANDVNGLAVGHVGRSLLLNHKGHAMAEAAVVRTDHALHCVVDDNRLAWVKDTLERHIVFDDVKLSEPSASVVTLQGTRADRVLEAAGLPVPAGSELAVLAGAWGEGSFAYRSERAGGGFDLVVSSEHDLDRLVADLVTAGAVEVGPQALAAARIAATAPTAGGEGGDGVLPQESGLTHLISYRKGCYLGQEIMARIEARGSMRRELATIELDGFPSEQEGEGASAREITSDDRRVGLLGTVARFPDGTVKALSVLRNDLPEDARLTVGGVSGRRLAVSPPIMPA